MNENYKIMRFKPFGISHSPAFLRELIFRSFKGINFKCTQIQPKFYQICFIIIQYVVHGGMLLFSQFRLIMQLKYI